MKTEFSYDEVVGYTKATSVDKIRQNQLYTESVLRELLREEAQLKGSISTEIPYYERIGFLEEYCKRQLVDVIDHLAEKAD